MRRMIKQFIVAGGLMLVTALPALSQQKPVEEKDYAAYLFTYFTGNHISEEAVRFAVSTD